MTHRPIPRHAERTLESAAQLHDLTSAQIRAAVHTYANHEREEGYTPTEAVRQIRDASRDTTPELVA